MSAWEIESSSRSSLLNAGPALLEGDRGSDLVEDLDRRGKLRLDRVGGEDPLRERVQCSDSGEVQLVQSGLGPLASYDVLVAVGHLLELGAQPVAQLCSSLDRERHGRDRRHRDAVVEHQVGHPADERRGFSRTSACTDEQGAVCLLADLDARGEVGGISHWRPRC